jgi:phosphotriesterase-related protein
MSAVARRYAGRMKRRDFLPAFGLPALGLLRANAQSSEDAPAFGSASPSAGAHPSILVHEHVLVDFVGADRITRDRYDIQDAFRAARPKLEALQKHGCVRMLECTPNYIGRDPRLLRMLEDATGIELWTNTGLYAAANHKFLPAFAKTETAPQLAKRWIAEARNGIDGMKPRFIKIGVNKAPLHEWDRKMVEAAAITSSETGLPIAAHTGDGPAAQEELAIIRKAGVDASKFIWVHAQNELDHSIHDEIAKAGAWVEFDGINERTVRWHQRCVEHMARANLLHRTLISHDSGWYRPGEPDGGQFNGYTYLYEHFQPKVENWFPRLLWDNPREAFPGATA